MSVSLSGTFPLFERNQWKPSIPLTIIVDSTFPPLIFHYIVKASFVNMPFVCTTKPSRSVGSRAPGIPGPSECHNRPPGDAQSAWFWVDALNGQMRKKGVDLGLSHLLGMAHLVEVDEPSYPMAVSLLGPPAVMARAKRLTSCYPGLFILLAS